MTVSQYELLGVDFVTDLVLPCRTGTSSDPIDIAVGDRVDMSTVAPVGTVIANLVLDGRHEYSLTRQSDGHVLRIPTICDFWIAEDLSQVRITPREGTDRELLGIILAGAGVSTILALQGIPVLHGSTVESNGRAIGFLGASGQGKSTMTALFCMAGWSFMGDDVLRIDIEDEVPLCHCGGLEIRLREKALRDPTWPARATTDGRSAVSPPSSGALADLDCFVIPFPARGATRVKVERLSPGESVEAIRYYQRIGGWVDPDLNRAFFAHSVALAKTVPVWVADIPWDAHLTTDVVGELADLVLPAGASQ